MDVGVPIAQRRVDMNYLGQMAAYVHLPDGIVMEMIHPDGGGAYALSYKAQKYINNLAPEDVPELLVFGHYHCSFYMKYRNVHFLQAPCFKDAGTWEKRKGLNPTIGGWMVEATIDTGQISKFKPELIVPR